MADQLSADKLGRQLIGVDREIDALQRLLNYKKPGGVNFNNSEIRERNKQSKKLERLIKLQRSLIAQIKVAEEQHEKKASNFPRMRS